MAALSVVVAAALVTTAVATGYGSLSYYGDASCSGRIYYRSVYPDPACTPDTTCTYAGPNSYFTVSCPSSYDLPVPYGTYSAGYLFNSTTTCSNDTFIAGSYTYYTLANNCNQLGTGYVKTTCGQANPTLSWCRDNLCQYCGTQPANANCTAVPETNLTLSNYCTSGANPSERPFAILITAVLAVAAVISAL